MATQAEKKKQERIKAIIADLNSNDDNVVLKALGKVRSKGNEEVVSPLVNLAATSKNAKVQKEAQDILLELKSTNAIEPLILELKNPKAAHIRALLISIFWNAGLNPSHHVDTFVDIATKGDYLECLECLTVIENLQPPFQEELINDSLIMLKDYFVENPNNDKDELLKSIARIIKQIDQSMDDLYDEA